MARGGWRWCTAKHRQASSGHSRGWTRSAAGTTRGGGCTPARREALCVIGEEGLERRVERHCLHAAALSAGLEAFGLQLFAQAGHRVPSVVTVHAPNGVSASAVRNRLLAEFNLEIACGLGAYAD